MTLSDPYLSIRQYCFGTILREHRRSRPASLALIDGDVRLTYAQLDSRVNRLANALQQRGVNRGDRLMWIGQNSFKVFELLLAAAKLGGIFCPANWRLSGAELGNIIADFDPRIVFWQEVEIGDLHRDEIARWEGDGRTHIQHDSTDERGYEALLAEGADIDEEHASNCDEPLLAIYTAAFDGSPSAALLSHNSLMLQGLISAHGQAIDENTCHLVSGPMFHVGVLMGAFATFLFGGCNLIVPRVDALQLLGLIEAERVTHGYLPLPTLQQMSEINADSRFDVSSLFTGRGLEEWRSTLVMPDHAPMAKATHGYGQTEVGGIAVHLALGGTGAGRPYPFMQFRIVDDAGNELPNGEVGEIVARGPMVMSGYWNRPQENARRSDLGWHQTNDLGRRNEDGSLVFVGPKTTMIKSGVENIYPAEIENCLRSHPAVADVCVIGVPDPKWDQNVKAIIVLKQGATPTPDDIIQHCRERIASYKKPKVVAFVTEIPKTSAGFTDRDAADAAHGGGGYPSFGAR